MGGLELGVPLTALVIASRRTPPWLHGKKISKGPRWTAINNPPGQVLRSRVRKVVIVEDVTTTGGSSIAVTNPYRYRLPGGWRHQHPDREEGAEQFSEAGIHLRR